MLPLDISSDRINLDSRLRKLDNRLYHDIVHGILSTPLTALGNISASLARLEKFENSSDTHQVAFTHLINVLRLRPYVSS